MAVLFSELRKQLVALLKGASDQVRSKAPDLHDLWQDGWKYAMDDVVVHKEHLYRCLAPHTSQADWAPDTALSLWAQIMYRDGYRVIPATMTSTQAFADNECGWWKDTLYRSLRDGNAFPPPVTPEWWEVVE